MISRIICNILSRRLSYKRCNVLNASRLICNTPAVPAKNTLQRFYSATPKTPDLIYIPHVFRWLKTKFQLKYLQKTWDPDFTEGAFIYGTSKAVCRITEIIHENRPEDLDELMTLAARLKLREVIKTRLTKTQKAIIKLRPEDIKILVPINVCFKSTKGNQKDCRIAMRVLALKWAKPRNGPMRLVLVALQTEFQRDYKIKQNSDWTISAFDILECVVLSSSPTNNG